MLPLASLPAPVVGHTAAAQLLGWSGAGVLAHQGGWDEILMVLVPVSLFAALLYVANQRASRLTAQRAASSLGDDGAASEDDAPTGDPGDTQDPATPATPPRVAPKNDRRGPV